MFVDFGRLGGAVEAVLVNGGVEHVPNTGLVLFERFGDRRMDSKGWGSYESNSDERRRRREAGFEEGSSAVAKILAEHGLECVGLLERDVEDPVEVVAHLTFYLANLPPPNQQLSSMRPWIRSYALI